MLEILHLHGFKCAGTTFASILQQNYGDRAIHIESTVAGDRLPWQFAHDRVEGTRTQSVSSHLVTLPPPSSGLARLHVAFVRSPRARLYSAFRFELRRGELSGRAATFDEYLDAVRTSTASNYQVRHLSPQDDGGWRARQGWQPRPELIDLERPDLLIGSVERFDESLVVLEQRIQQLGRDFDASYAEPLNTSPDPDSAPLHAVPVDMVELDEVLCERVDAALSATVRQIPDFPARMADFRRRCRRRAEQGAPPPVADPHTWTYIDVLAESRAVTR